MHADGLMPTDGKQDRRSAAAVVLAALILLFASGPVAPTASAEDPSSSTGSGEGESAVADSESSPSGDHYVAEILDTVYTVQAAEFFALDLPVKAEGSDADHLSGTISMAEKKGDIIVRVFRAADYKGWLKKRDLKQTNPIWSSKRARTINLDLDLPPGTPITLLLDNGYSLRTPKKVHLQLQMQYLRDGSAPATSASSPAKSTGASEDDVVTPRSNTEEDAPPPPPPPPDDGTQ
jgi:hypothetical protein